MNVVLASWIGVNFILFSALSAFAWLTAQRLRARRAPIRRLSQMVSAVSALFALSAVQRIILQLARADVLSDAWRDFALGAFQAVLTVATSALVIPALLVGRDIYRYCRTTERVVSVLTERLTFDASVSELGLTARELEVLELIGGGTLSDDELAATLSISPATAATHVRNIMRKAGTSDRRELLLLVATQPAASAPASS